MQNDNEEIQQQNSMRLQYLTARHQELDDQVDEMNKRTTLLPSEVMTLTSHTEVSTSRSSI